MPSAADFNGRVELHIAAQVYHAAVQDGQLHIARGAEPDADAVLKAEVATFVALVYEGARFNDALRDGSLDVSGDKQVARRFLGLFTLPQVATPA